MRLDKYFTACGILSRSQVKKEIKKNLICVNGAVAKSSDIQVEPGVDEVTYRGQTVFYEEYVYYLMNKPAGIVSATEDNLHKTVVDLVKELYPEEKHDIFPVGRLDIDTEGLLLLTNDGALSHELLSPTKHVAKTYYVEFDIESDIICDKLDDLQEALADIETGIDIGDDKPCKPAKLEVLELGEGHSGKAYLEIVEGRFHQVKRMFQALDCRVTYLKRVSFGDLSIPEDLKVGQVAKISRDDIS